MAVDESLLQTFGSERVNTGGISSDGVKTDGLTLTGLTLAAGYFVFTRGQSQRFLWVTFKTIKIDRTTRRVASVR
jgi:hypothetical protein